MLHSAVSMMVTAVYDDIPYTTPTRRSQVNVHHYTKFPTFHTGEGRHQEPCLDEFDDAREVVAALSAEYRAAEHADFVRPPLANRMCKMDETNLKFELKQICLNLRFFFQT